MIQLDPHKKFLRTSETPYNKSIQKFINESISNINEIQKKIENIIYIKPHIKSPGILNMLKTKEKTKFNRLFIASQSSCDIYNIIDPNTKDAFCTCFNNNYFIEFELEQAVPITGIKIYSSYKYFPKSFNIEIEGKNVFTTEKAIELNGVDNVMKIDIDPILGKKVRFIKTGPNWDKNTNYVFIKRIELLSKQSREVFANIVKSSENQDPHKSKIFISSSKYGFNSFYIVNKEGNTSTLNKENSWFQIELTQGFVIITGFRLWRGDGFKIKNYKIICTNDVSKQIENWTTLFEINEKLEYEHMENDIYILNQPSPPVKYVRLIQTGPNWSDNLFLKFFNFDLFGLYF